MLQGHCKNKGAKIETSTWEIDRSDPTYFCAKLMDHRKCGICTRNGSYHQKSQRRREVTRESNLTFKKHMTMVWSEILSQ